ncbi:hypothetical protein BJX68DRAFT_274117 [Aspergillus pseudodeflectus]|uniref:Uncharacterized protein n=1 Tax=Aspergillus pseudodeflectus TaxID=176178 RepID=A0ABR4KS85_9EURO
MVRGYTTLYSKTPRSFLFAVVTNGCDRSTAMWPPERVHRVVADTLALINILSDPGNRALLEAVRALAEDYYANKADVPINERPSVPDSPQPPYVKPDPCYSFPVPARPKLPSHDDRLSEFPFTTTCLLLSLLRDDDSNSARPGDIRLQPLSTVFRADCNEYGLIVLDISDLDSGVKYGIVAFRMHYMAEVLARITPSNWDPIEDPPPLTEPDVVPDSPRHRVPLSIHQWLSKYFLDQDTEESQAEVSSQSPLSGSPDRLQAYLQNAHIDRAIDDMLLHARGPLESPIARDLERLVDHREQLRKRLEEAPEALGRCGHKAYILRVAYAGCRHLNRLKFRNLAPSVIAAALASDELRDASALSRCVEQFKPGADELGHLVVALAQSTALIQLCLVQRPDGDSDDASASFCSQVLLRWEGISGGGLGSLSLYPTSAFSTSLRSRKFLTLSSTVASSVFPVRHIFMFEKVLDTDPDAGQQDETSSSCRYHGHYAMNSTLLDAERFAGRFLAFLQFLNSGSRFEKAILRFAYGGALSPIPVGYFNHDLGQNKHSNVKLGDILPGSWVHSDSTDRRGRWCGSNHGENSSLQYSFVRVIPNSAEQQQQSPSLNLAEVTGGLTDFLRETAPCSDTFPWEEQVEQLMMDRVSVMDESCAWHLLNQFL